MNKFVNKLKTIFRENRTARGGMMWRGTRTDLIELSYLIYKSGCVTNVKGKPATFKMVYKALFGQFGVPVPDNPTKIVDNLKHRRNPKQVSVIYRALWYLYHKV